MTDDDRAWLVKVADALDTARRHPDQYGTEMMTILLSDELARGVADRLRLIAEEDDE